MNRVIVARSAQEMERVKPAWDELQTAGKYTIFQSFKWNQLAARVFAARESPCVVFAETEGGAAIVPAAVTKRHLTLLGEEMFDYRDVISMGDGEALSLAWKTLAKIQPDSTLPFSVKGVRGSSFGFVLQSRRNFETGLFANAPAVLHCDAGSKPHPRLARNIERLRDEGCDLKVSSGDDVSLVRSIYQSKALQDNSSLFHDPLRIEMACAMAQISADQCEIFLLLKGATMVAALLTFVDQRCRRLYTIYYDRHWAKYSPGVSLLHHVIQSSLKSGLDIDLMTGEQPYKQRFATFNEPLYTLGSPHAKLEKMGDATQISGKAAEEHLVA